MRKAIIGSKGAMYSLDLAISFLGMCLAIMLILSSTAERTERITGINKELSVQGKAIYLADMLAKLPAERIKPAYWGQEIKKSDIYGAPGLAAEEANYRRVLSGVVSENIESGKIDAEKHKIAPLLGNLGDAKLKEISIDFEGKKKTIYSDSGAAGDCFIVEREMLYFKGKAIPPLESEAEKKGVARLKVALCGD